MERVTIIISVEDYPGDTSDAWNYLNNKYNLCINTTSTNPRYKPRVRVVSVDKNTLKDLEKEQHIKFIYDGEIFIDLS